MLEVRDLEAFYGKSHILHGVHFGIRKGEIVSLLGRNGVGRSTTAAVVSASVLILFLDAILAQILLTGA